LKNKGKPKKTIKTKKNPLQRRKSMLYDRQGFLKNCRKALPDIGQATGKFSKGAGKSLLPTMKVFQQPRKRGLHSE